MLFSYNWLQSFFKDKLPKPEKLAELLVMHSFEVEEVKKVGEDFVLDIDVLPNRGPDCFSHFGIARECSVITGSKLKIPNSRLKEDKNLRTRDFIAVEVENEENCSRYTARVVADLKVKPSPRWIQERLKACGLRPINNVVDVTNYVMLETGQPLHAFDFDKISGDKKKKIIVRKAKKGEEIITLDNERYNLDENILIIADKKNSLAIAGIKGGKRVEIDKETKTIVLESANFNPQVVRRGSKKLNLKTDASWRFEHGIDPNLAEAAINRAASLIQEIAEGKVTSGLVDFYPKKVSPKKIRLDLGYVKKILGVKIPVKEIKNILTRLEFKVIDARPQKLQQIIVEVPSFRLDVSLPEDLIEEIGRIYGYRKIKPVFPKVSLIAPKRNLRIFWEDVTKNILKEVGFTEVYNYSFIGEKEARIFGYEITNLVEVKNPISIEKKYLRPSLIPNLLKNINTNFKQYNEIKLFELGKTFTKKRRASSRYLEKRRLTGFITGDTLKHSNLTLEQVFYQAKGVADLLLEKLGISNIWHVQYQSTFKESEASVWHPKRMAEIKINHKRIGFLGEISPSILEDLKIPVRVAVFDLNFEILPTLASEEHEYIAIACYPAVVRDLAVLVPRKVKAVDVLNKISAAGGSLIRDINLFDVYEGAELPRGKKSLAFHIIYQAEDRTLTAKEIDKIQNKIVEALKFEAGWEVRQ